MATNAPDDLFHTEIDPDGQVRPKRFEAMTYPSFDTPSGTCSISSIQPVGIDLNRKETRIFVADASKGVAEEFKYPAGGGNGEACTLVGSVTTSGGLPVGIAVDRPESL